jgi:hypothetical protein
MKKIVIAVLAVVLVAGFVFAKSKPKEASDDDKKPTVVVTGGQFTGSIHSDGNGRSVVIINTYTGDFEVFDIDRQGMERKPGADNEIYYSAIKYSHKDGTRQLVKYKPASEAKAGDAQPQE